MIVNSFLRNQVLNPESEILQIILVPLFSYLVLIAALKKLFFDKHTCHEYTVY